MSSRSHDRAAADPRAHARQVLLADDEAPVRVTARRFLQRAGFRVLEAKDGVDALEVWERAAGEVDVLVTDALMPRLHGYALAARLRERRPGLPVVVISGFADVAELASALDPEDAALRLIEKPFTGEQLVAAVRAVLTTEGPGHGA